MCSHHHAICARVDSQFSLLCNLEHQLASVLSGIESTNHLGVVLDTAFLDVLFYLDFPGVVTLHQLHHRVAHISHMINTDEASDGDAAL